MKPTTSVDFGEIFRQKAEQVLRDAGELEAQVRPILLDLADMSATAAAARFAGNPIPAAEKSIATTYRRLELSGMIEIRDQWQNAIKDLFTVGMHILIAAGPL